LLSLAERIEIEDLVRAVLVFLLDAAEQHQGVVVGRRTAEVETAKGEVGAAVREVLHVGRNESEDSQVPVGYAREIHRLQHEMPEPHDLRGLDRRAHRAVDARRVCRRVGARCERLAQGQALDRALLTQQPHAAAGRIEELDASPAAWNPVGREPARSEILDVTLELCVVGHAERRPGEAIAG
jgi:hypothetical protein